MYRSVLNPDCGLQTGGKMKTVDYRISNNIVFFPLSSAKRKHRSESLHSG